jgi:ubiquinone/menaquinone biosynthesis C-methylase UbiE
MSSSSPYSSEQFIDDEADNEISRLEDQARVRWPQEVVALRNAGLKAGNSIVDIGCGPGVITGFLAEEVDESGLVLGIEKNERLVNVAKTRNAKYNQVQIINSDACDLTEVKDNSFDFAYTRFVLQHLPDPSKLLTEAIRILKPGGKLIVMDVDDSLFHITPYHEGMTQFLFEASKGQNIYGGDRYIGHKIPCMMFDAGFTEIHASVYTFTSKNITPNQFLDITTKFKLELLDPALKDWGENMLNEVYRKSQEGAFFGSAGVYCVVGEKEM